MWRSLNLALTVYTKIYTGLKINSIIELQQAVTIAQHRQEVTCSYGLTVQHLKWSIREHLFHYSYRPFINILNISGCGEFSIHILSHVDLTCHVVLGHSA